MFQDGSGGLPTDSPLTIERQAVSGVRPHTPRVVGSHCLPVTTSQTLSRPPTPQGSTLRRGEPGRLRQLVLSPLVTSTSRVYNTLAGINQSRPPSPGASNATLKLVAALSRPKVHEARPVKPGSSRPGPLTVARVPPEWRADAASSGAPVPISLHP